MKVAHLIMAYKSPSQLKMLVDQLWHPDSRIFIHLDKKVAMKQFSFIATEGKATFISDRRICNWGGFSFVHAITGSIKEILATKQNYDFINLMSGQDYPIKPISQFHAFLSTNLGKSFVSFEKDSDSDWWKHAVTRYQHYHFTDYNIRGRYRVQSLVNRLAPKRQFPLNLKLYGSAVSSWWTMNTDCARYITEFLDNNPKLLKFMKLTWAADEFLYATIIMNSPFKDTVINNNLRHIEWLEGKPNPKILLESDFSALTCSSNFFARKFDINQDSTIITMLDNYLLSSIAGCEPPIPKTSNELNLSKSLNL